MTEGGGRSRRTRRASSRYRLHGRREAGCVPLRSALAPYGEQILDCFPTDSATLTVEEIANATSIQLATVESLAYILVMLRCLAKDETGQYRRIRQLPAGWILTTAGGV